MFPGSPCVRKGDSQYRLVCAFLGTLSQRHAGSDDVSPLRSIALALRFILELCALAALGYWGWKTGHGALTKLVLGIGAPLGAAVVWGMVVSPKATVDASPAVRFAVEIAVFGSAILGLWVSGQPDLAVALVFVYVVHRVLLSISSR